MTQQSSAMSITQLCNTAENVDDKKQVVIKEEHAVSLAGMYHKHMLSIFFF